FTGLAAFSELDLRFNQLSEFNSKLPPSLTILYLDSNPIPYIEKSLLSNLTNLVTLGLSGLKLEKLDQNIFENCHSLAELNLSSNKLKNLDKNLFQMKLTSCISLT
ncbi:decorin, partial [Brachionus plicatilis]